MSLRSKVKKEGDYPSNTIGKRELLEVENKTIVLTTYEKNSLISIYLGGVKHWCIHCDIVKGDNGKIEEKGYLIKIRYDLLCSMEENIQRGGDISKLLKLLLQYIHNTYPSVKYLSFTDLSSRRCDNGIDTNLAVMTYLYSGKTWYEKNFDVTIAEQSEDTLKQILHHYNESKKVPWIKIKDIMSNYKILPYSESDLETLYNNSETWKEFFETIHAKIGMSKFCIFVSSWLDGFTLKYFNNLMGLTYKMQIKPTNISYIQKDFKGGRYKSFFKGARKNRTIKRFSEME
jgi:predicted transcriptional regulator with HTH domain